MIDYKRVTIEDALESDMFGYQVIHDADLHKILFTTYCGRCGKVFYNETVEYYCQKCKEGKELC